MESEAHRDGEIAHVNIESGLVILFARPGLSHQTHISVLSFQPCVNLPSTAATICMHQHLQQYACMHLGCDRQSSFPEGQCQAFFVFSWLGKDALIQVITQPNYTHNTKRPRGVQMVRKLARSYPSVHRYTENNCASREENGDCICLRS